MKLSTRARYGARLMLELALHYDKGPVLLKDIARAQEVSEKYLWHLIPPLKSASLINSTRSAHGGYTLANPPSQITLGEVIRVLEGPFSLVECVNTPQVCSRISHCVTRDIWKEVRDKILEVLNSITLEDMLIRQKEKK